MKRILSCLILAGLMTVPAVALAEPQYVYVRYGSGEPYLFVTTHPIPEKPFPYYIEGTPTRTGYYPYTRTWVERSDGVRFDSEVGATCDLMNTDIHFGPNRTALAPSERYVLGFLGRCITRGKFAGTPIKIVTGYDGSPASTQLAMARLEVARRAPEVGRQNGAAQVL